MSERLPDTVHRREAMIARGAYGFLDKAMERFVPLDKVVVLTPPPACPTWGAYSSAHGTPAIEVKYDRDEGVYLAFNAAGLVSAARQRGETFIRAFVEPDHGDIGRLARASL